MRKVAGFARLAAAVVGILALYTHLLYSLGSGGAAAPNFFSYFTMQSAIAAVLLWIVSGLIALRRDVDPLWLSDGRMLVTTYQVVSGVVYSVIVLEAVSERIPIQVPISSQVLHYWMPALALIDWFFAPGRPPVPWSTLRVVLVFPVVWGGFTMLRGFLIGWYPYFFLDPYQVSGPAEFVLFSAIVLAFIGAVAAGLVALSYRLPPRRRREEPADGTDGADSSDGEERLEAPPGPVDDLVVIEIGEGKRAIPPDQPHEDR